MIDEMFQNLPLFMYKKPNLLIRFFIVCHYIFYLMNVYVNILSAKHPFGEKKYNIGIL